MKNSLLSRASGNSDLRANATNTAAALAWQLIDFLGTRAMSVNAAYASTGS
jgi:hypothetical protein